MPTNYQRRRQDVEGAIRVLSRQRLAYAIRTGRLVRGPCEVCAAPKTEAHHDDYSEPLAVRWLCRPHHSEWHAHNTPRTAPFAGFVHVPGRLAHPTHCVSGHPLGGLNLYIRPNGKRTCVTCQRERERRYAARKRHHCQQGTS